MGTAAPPRADLIRRAVIAGALLVALLPALASAQGLTLGFADGVLGSPDATLREAWLQRAQDIGAGIARIDVGWAAAKRPASPRDPADPAYDWSAADAAVEHARAHGLRVLAEFTGLPRWAQRADVPSGDDPATYRPRPGDVGAYGQALATHFAGRVSAFQVWNEPNLSTYLTPQWSKGRAVAPAIYRAMLNAFDAGVKRAEPGALVVTAGTASFGRLGPGNRILPVRFWRELLKKRASFDVLAHDPYSAAGPTHHARNGADVAIPDMGRLRRLLQHAHHRVRMWVTEISSTPNGVSPQTQARRLEHSLELLWRAGVDTVTWSHIRGLYFGDGRAKPAASAFRFPFVAGGDQVWLRSPAAGTLQIRRRGRTVKSVNVHAGQVLLLHGIRTRRGDLLQGVIGGLRSLTWRATH